jgi:beta-lactamase regulating signal transducer with metallopeptidase domain
MDELLGHPVVEALAWSLVHFVWQGAAIALVAALAMRAARTAEARYLMGVGALAAMLAAPVLTAAVILAPIAFPDTPAVMVEAPAAPGEPRTADAVASPAASTMSAGRVPIGVLVVVWAAGVFFFTVRLGGGWIVARRAARRAVRPAEARLQALAADLSRRLDIRRAVAVLESSAAAVPMLVGWLKPAVVLPAAALAGLSPAQIEALLAHELAHVRRHDFLINVLQSLVEAALFYHPAVWWLSRRVRDERELCCDDLAVGLCDRLVYATALTDLAAMTTPRVALAATDGNLLGRVRRVLAGPGGNDMGTVRWVPAAILAVGLSAAIPGALLLARVAPASESQQVRHVRPVQTHEMVQEIHPEGARLHADRIHPEEAQAAQSQAQREAELVRLIRELELKLAEVRERTVVDRAGTAADRERVEVERARREMSQAAREMQNMRDVVARTARERVQHDTELQALVRDLEAARALASRGLLAESQVRDKEKLVAAMQAGRVDERVHAEVADAVKEVERARQLVERGLLPARELEAMRGRLEHLRQNQGVDEARMKEPLLELEQRLTQLRARGMSETHPEMVASARQLQELLTERQLLRHADVAEQVRRSVDQSRTAEQVRRTVDQARVADEVRRSVDEQRAVAEERMQRERRVPDRMDAMEFETTTRVFTSGDVLRIVINGEPDLPTTYQVRTDGTVRIPLLGSFRVVGQTSQQVRDAIGRKLSDLRLGSASAVTIQVRRASRVR